MICQTIYLCLNYLLRPTELERKVAHANVCSLSKWINKLNEKRIVVSLLIYFIDIMSLDTQDQTTNCFAQQSTGVMQNKFTT